MTIVQHNPTTTTATIGNENQEMIVSDQNNDQGGSQDEYITLQMLLVDNAMIILYISPFSRLDIESSS